MGKMNISNLAGGALVERADFEINKILENILDPNTNAEKKRKLKIEIEFTGNEDRDLSKVKFWVKSVLIPQRTISTLVAFDTDQNGAIVAEELGSKSIMGQVQIDNDGIIIQPEVTNRKILNIK